MTDEEKETTPGQFEAAGRAGRAEPQDVWDGLELDETGGADGRAFGAGPDAGGPVAQ